MEAPLFSANLGYLWKELPLLEAIKAAGEVGFLAVEMHSPYAVDPVLVKDALLDAAIPLLSINTKRGNIADNEVGLTALTGREADARLAIDQALDYADETGARFIHVMAGRASGSAAMDVFVENLRYAVERASTIGVTLLLEPINSYDVKDYFLQDNATAAAIIEKIGSPDIKIMFDCYHVGRMGKPILEEFKRYSHLIGHVQFASVPDRHEPDHGPVDYFTLLPQLIENGYNGYFGAEYAPRTSTEQGLGWLAEWQLNSIMQP